MTVYDELHHENPSTCRTEEHRLACAQEVWDKIQETGELWELFGIRGFPILQNLPHFDASFSVVTDTLHVVLLGIGKDVVKILLDNSGNPWNLKNSLDPNMTGNYECLRF